MRCLLLLLLAFVSIVGHEAQPLHAQQRNQAIHQHIPIIPEDLLPNVQQTTTSYATTTEPPTVATTTASTTTTHHAQQPTLAYLTPWNRDGYAVSVNYSHSFTHLSPVWFQIKATTQASKQHAGRRSLAILITGSHDVDSQWMAAVRAANPAVAIVPRFIVEMTAPHLTKLITTERMQRQLHKRVLEVIDQYGFDGLVLEASDLHAIARREGSGGGSSGGSGGKEESKLVAKANDLIRAFGKALHTHKRSLSFTLVVRPPFPRSPYFGAKDYQSVHADVDYFSLMTYDFSSGSESPGPNSPLSWAKQSVYALVGEEASGAERAKVLMGLNMYGMRWKEGVRGGEAVLGRDYMQMVAGAQEGGKKVKRVWQDDSAEERTEVEGEAVVYYPTAQSVKRRVELANREGCGLSLWEIGQGLPELYEQL